MATIVYYCLPLLQEYSSYTTSQSTEIPSLEAYPTLIELVESYGWHIAHQDIDDCKVYEQCPWDDMEKLPTQRFFEATATEEEVSEAKKAFLTQYGSIRGQTIFR